MGKDRGGLPFFERENGAGGGTRTLMPSLAPDFESSASAILLLEKSLMAKMSHIVCRPIVAAEARNLRA